MGLNRFKSKNRSTNHSFSALPHHITDSNEYAQLSAKAVKLLIDIFCQFRGNNNGDLCCAWKLMGKRGWKSRDTLFKAKTELESNGWIERTQQGLRGTPNKPNLYAVSWLPINECKNKLDVKETRVASNKWKSKSDTRLPC